MARATAHPDHRLISSEDVHGTDVIGASEEVIGEIDHLLIDKSSGRVAYAVMSFGGILGLAHSHYPASPRSSYATRRSSVTIRGVTGAGKRAHISTTERQRTGLPDIAARQSQFACRDLR